MSTNIIHIFTRFIVGSRWQSIFSQYACQITIPYWTQVQTFIRATRRLRKTLMGAQGRRENNHIYRINRLIQLLNTILQVPSMSKSGQWHIEVWVERDVAGRRMVFGWRNVSIDMLARLLETILLPGSSHIEIQEQTQTRRAGWSTFRTRTNNVCVGVCSIISQSKNNIVIGCLIWQKIEGQSNFDDMVFFVVYSRLMQLEIKDVCICIYERGEANRDWAN